MRVRPDDVGVHERGTMSLAAVFDGTLKGCVTGDRISAVHFFKMKIGKSGNQARDAAASRLNFHWNRDRVAVIFHAENYRQFSQSRGVHRFPELALASGAVTEGNISDFIIAEADALELAII